MQQDQSILIENLKQGKESAFIYMIDHYSKRLFAYALTLSCNEIMAQDIIQNVFLRTWEKRKKISIKTSLQNYLFKAVYNEFINQYKKNRATIFLEQKYFDSLEKVTMNSEDNLLDKVIERVSLEIQELPPKSREVFLLSRKEGLTNSEIADYLNVSIKTVESHITKSFFILRKKMGSKMNSILFLLIGIDRKTMV